MAKIIIGADCPVVFVETGFLYWVWEETMNVVSHHQSMIWGVSVGVDEELDLSELEPDVFRQVINILYQIAEHETMTEWIRQLQQVVRQDWRYQTV